MEQRAIELFKKFCPKGQKQLVINQRGDRVLVIQLGRKFETKILTKGD